MRSSPASPANPCPFLPNSNPCLPAAVVAAPVLLSHHLSCHCRHDVCVWQGQWQCAATLSTRMYGCHCVCVCVLLTHRLIELCTLPCVRSCVVCSRRPVCVPAAAQGRYGGGEGCAQAAGGLHPALRPSVSAWWVLVWWVVAWWVLVVLVGAGCWWVLCWVNAAASQTSTRLPAASANQ